LAEVIDAVSAEVPCFLALRATTANGGDRRVGGGGGATFRVGLISGAFAPCPITMNVCVKLLEIVNDASSCKASVDEVGYEELVGIPDDIQDAMANGSCDGGGDDGVQVEGGTIVAPQAILEQLLHFNGLQDDVEVEEKGGVIVTEIDEVKDVDFFLEKTFDEGKGVSERGGVEEGGRHYERGWFQRKLVGLVANVRRLSEELLQVLPSFIALKNLGSILQIVFGFPCLI